MTNNEHKVLSFCIPTYKRAKLVEECVKSILEIDSPLIEVFVSDNDSPDDTEDVISSIEDPRIRYHRNSMNIGGTMNIVQTIKMAKGDWVFLLSDEDSVIAGSLAQIIKDLADGNYTNAAVLMGNVKAADGSYIYKFKETVHRKGDEAVSTIGFTHPYMSGIMLNKGCLDYQQLESYSMDDGVYPHINILTRACMNGDAVTRDVDVCFKRSGHEESISHFERPRNQIYCEPNNRFEQFKTFTRLADRSIESGETKMKVFLRLYSQYLYAATYGWKRVIDSKSRRDYYGLGDDIKFDLSAQAKEFHERAIAFYEEIVPDSRIRKDLMKRTSKKTRSFRTKRAFNTVYLKMPGTIRNNIRNLYYRMK